MSNLGKTCDCPCHQTLGGYLKERSLKMGVFTLLCSLLALGYVSSITNNVCIILLTLVCSNASGMMVLTADEIVRRKHNLKQPLGQLGTVVAWIFLPLTMMIASQTKSQLRSLTDQEILHGLKDLNPFRQKLLPGKHD